MRNQQKEKEDSTKSPYNDAPFLFSEHPKGSHISLETLCTLAGLPCVVTLATPLDIRIHNGNLDFIAVRPGERIYCLSTQKAPSSSRSFARYALERLAYGAREWASYEILSSERRRNQYNAEIANIRSPQTDNYKQKMRETLPVRRILREQPSATHAEIAKTLNLPIYRVTELIGQILK